MKKSRGIEEEFQPQPPGTPEEHIKRLRLNVILHSCIYYEFNENLWDDHTFDHKCKELVKLLGENPGAYSDRFDKYFEGWSGASGFHFPHRDPWVLGKAQELIQISNNIEGID